MNNKKFSLFFIILFLTLTQTTDLFSQQTVGLFIKTNQAEDGYVLFAPTGNPVTYLMDKCGKEIHTWTSDYSPGQTCYLLEDGSLLRPARIGNMAFPAAGSGGLVEKFDWDGNLTWSFLYSDSLVQQHHDVEPLPNGNVLILAREKRNMAQAIAAGRDSANMSDTELYPEHVVEIQPIGPDSGIIVWEWHFWDHLVQDFDNSQQNFGVVADHPELFNINFLGLSGAGSDWLHANSVKYNPILDQIMISSRSMSEFWIIDHSTTSLEASGHTGGTQGKGGDFLYRWGNPITYDRGDLTTQVFYGQHSPNWIEAGLPGAGMITVFNNGVGRTGGDYSSIDVVQPPVDGTGAYSIAAGQAFGPDSLYWTYVSNPPSAFYSANISGAQRLRNGNTIICEGRSGHFFEVDSSGNIQWDYINPVDAGGPVDQGTSIVINNVFRATQYYADYPGFAGRDLTPGNPIELNPTPTVCDTLVSISPAHSSEEINVKWKFTNDHLEIFNPDKLFLEIRVMNILGQPLLVNKGSENQVSLDLSGITNQVLLIDLRPENNSRITAKILKQ